MSLDSKSFRLPLWALGFAVVLVFGQCVFFGFITFDDGAYVFLNPHVIRGLSRAGIVSAFTAEVAGNWHPVTMLTYMTVSRAVGPQPWSFHLLNVAIHAANSLLLFRVLRALLTVAPQASASSPVRAESSERLISAACWFATALFALHPLRVESVVWVSELKDLLCALFGLLTIRAYLAWIEEPSRKGYLVVAGLFAAGLMSKPMLVTLPCVLLLLDYWPLGRLRQLTDFRRLAALTFEKLPLFALSIAAGLLTIHYQKMGDAVRSLQSFPFPLRLQTAVLAYAGYLEKMIWPVDLALFYPYPKSWPPLAVGGASLLILLLTVSALLAARRFPAWFTGWFWYLGTLVPVIGLVQVGQQSMADRYTYIPSMGLSLVLARGLVLLVERSSLSVFQRRLLAGLAIALVGALSVQTWKQTSLWKTGETIYRHTLRVTGDNWPMRQNLAALLAHTGRADEGIEHLREALRIEPANASLWDDLGYLLQLKGRIPEALAALEKAVQIDPRRGSVHRLLAALLRRKGETGGAVAHLQAALRIAPKDEQALIDFARLRASARESDFRDAAEAVALARRAGELSQDQNPDALDALAAAYAENRQFDLALESARRGAERAETIGNTALAAGIRKRITLYERQLPFRE